MNSLKSKMPLPLINSSLVMRRNAKSSALIWDIKYANTPAGVPGA